MILPPESLRLAAGKLQVILDQYRSGRRVFDPAIFEIEQNRKDGTRVWTEVSARPFLDGEGRMAGISGVTRDISERKKAEKALLRAKMEWERTFDSLPDLIAILDDRHRIVRANRAMAERLGLTPRAVYRADLLRKYSWHERTHRLLPTRPEPCRRAAAHGGSPRREARRRFPRELHGFV